MAVSWWMDKWGRSRERSELMEKRTLQMLHHEVPIHFISLGFPLKLNQFPKCIHACVFSQLLINSAPFFRLSSNIVPSFSFYPLLSCTDHLLCPPPPPQPLHISLMPFSYLPPLFPPFSTSSFHIISSWFWPPNIIHHSLFSAMATVPHLHSSAPSVFCKQGRWKSKCTASEGHACALI